MFFTLKNYWKLWFINFLSHFRLAGSGVKSTLQFVIYLFMTCKRAWVAILYSLGGVTLTNFTSLNKKVVNIFGINFDKFLILNWILKVGIYAQRGEVRKARYVSEKAKHVATIGILIGTLTVVYMFVQKVKFFQQVRVKGRAFDWA